MPVPGFQLLMLPALTALSDGQETPVSKVRARVAQSEGLSQSDLAEMLPSGRQTVFANRVSWAVIFMERAGLLERSNRGIYKLADEGRKLLKRGPKVINNRLLRDYPSFVEWRKRANESSRTSKDETDTDHQITDTPEELMDHAHRQLRGDLQTDVLERIRQAPPEFLERVVLDLLRSMGYGGGDPSMGRVTGGPGDGGIDAAIREDALGLDEVYVQAKKFEKNTVGEGDLRNFAGAIDAAGTSKGVFVTTSVFTKAARKYVQKSPKRIVLIDGEELARLMVENNVGVRIQYQYKINRIDEDYFTQSNY
ncbi:MAG: restriction endonuclease [Chloroflexota bacterium]|nr:restriction endonuclease [Caldilineaceae bacterium]MDE0455178.1 restriction endonuclease [Gammaproteobacteria bacterium]MDE2839851.1 restriction endonuclease [Chloroflexota bacterium]